VYRQHRIARYVIESLREPIVKVVHKYSWIGRKYLCGSSAEIFDTAETIHDVAIRQLEKVNDIVSQRNTEGADSEVISKY
jgi:hypothetical protein